MKKTIVSVMAHADDLEETAGGTFAKYIDEGYKGLVIILSRCNSGWNGIPDRPEYVSSLEIVPQRRAEAKRAADVYGADFYMGDLLENNYTLRDGRRIVPSFRGAMEIYSRDSVLGEDEIEEDDLSHGTTIHVAAGFGRFDSVHPEVQAVIDLLVQCEPSLVLGQTIGNFNPDHLSAAQIAAMSWIRASETVELGPFWLPVTHPSEHAYAFPRLPVDRWIDVTGYEEINLRALACHVCQGGASEATQQMVRDRWRHYGDDYGVRSAEGFCEVYAGRGPSTGTKHV